jgi:hypothetical protein
MMEKSTFIPFGLRFAEQPAEKAYTIPTYDEEEDISVVIGEGGQKFPFVEYYPNISTKTATSVQEENTDEDQDYAKIVATGTATKVKEEVSDSDDEIFTAILGTKTDTFVQAEQTDEDPGVDSGPKPPITTKTFTNVAVEETDSD